jgi:hypothetical protein
MTRLTMLFIAVALVLPGAALAMPTNEVSGAQPQATQDLRAPDRDSAAILAAPGTTAPASALDKHGVDQAAQQRKWTATGRYYASFGATKALPAPADEPAAVATGGNGVGWTLAIGSGIALMLIAGGLGVYAGRTIHPRHIGA